MRKTSKRDGSDQLVLLHVGCGPRNGPGAQVPEMFAGYEEWRMDIDPAVEPDVIGSITNIDLPDNAVDGVYASHILEHVEQWDVHQALCEVLRVLRPLGVALIVVPDLERVAQEILEHPGMIEARTPNTPFVVAPLDMIFGHQPAIYEGQEYMRHRTAFTQLTLTAHLEAAGFGGGKVEAYDWQLIAVAVKGVFDGKETNN
jgi:SAM-dependent methyltransferase